MVEAVEKMEAATNTKGEDFAMEKLENESMQAEAKENETTAAFWE